MSIKHDPRITHEEREFSFLKNTPEYAYKYYNMLFYRFTLEVSVGKQEEFEDFMANLVTDLYYIRSLTSGARGIPMEFEVRFANEDDALTFKMMDLNWLVE